MFSTRPNIHPGEILREEFLKPAGVDPQTLARDLKLPRDRVEDLVDCRGAVTVDTALRLSHYFDIVTSELRRARYNPNAVMNFGENGDDDDGDGEITNLDNLFAVNPFEGITVSGGSSANDGDAETTDGECIQFAYGNAPGGAFRVISRAVVNGRGVIRMNRDPAAVPNCGTGVDLTSPQVDVTLLAFNFDNTNIATDPDYDTIRITIQGRLVADNNTVRRFVETVRLRTPLTPPTPVLPPPPAP